MTLKQFCVANFYSFFTNKNLEVLKYQITLLAKKQNINGSVILAHEGINCSLSGKEEDIRNMIEKVQLFAGSPRWTVHINYANFDPFAKFKVRIKPEIVSTSCTDLAVEQFKGEYVSSCDWEQFINQKDVALIDVRNTYEFEMGHFNNAINPKTKYFRDFAAWLEDNSQDLKDKKIAMYCTGGIRCEKATTYLKQNLNFKEVYQLEGGILEYLRQFGHTNTSGWQGECFVFDDRISLKPDLSVKQI
jgi:UPF0176 protein